MTDAVSKTTAIRAALVVPVRQPMIRDGMVLVRDGRILKVATAEQIMRSESFDSVHDLGQSALLPGLINAHTHLEFSDLPKPPGEPGIAFTDWVRQVMRLRRTVAEAPDSETQKQHAIQLGLGELQRCGTTFAGEIATQTFVPDSQTYVPGSQTFVPDLTCTQLASCYELIGLSPERIQMARESAQVHLRAFGTASVDSPSLPGLSPHAPYSCHQELLDWACDLSANRRFPVAMHLAETRDELQLLADGSGPLRDMLEEFGVWQPTAFAAPKTVGDYLHSLAAAWRSLVVHGNYLTPEDHAFLAQHSTSMTVVYCPRTHCFFQHESYPLTAMLNAGVRIALGTDSRGSNPDLSIWNEARHVVSRHPDVPPQSVLEMITSDAAVALGIESLRGSLSAGCAAVFTKVETADRFVDSKQSHEEILERLIQEGIPQPVAI